MKIRTVASWAFNTTLLLVVLLVSNATLAGTGTTYATADSRTGKVRVVLSGLINDYHCSNSVTLYESKGGARTPILTTPISSGTTSWEISLYRESGTYAYSATQTRVTPVDCTNPSTDNFSESVVTLNRENPSQFDNLRPFITLNSPAAGQNLISGTAYPVTISAVDTGGSINRVEIRDGSTPLVTLTQGTNSIYSYNWTPTTTSTTPVYKVLTATAYDNQGASTSVSQTFLVSLNGAVATTSQTIDFNKYDVYYGDFNNDGNTNDIYLYGRDTFILLYGDVSVPIILQGPPSYVFYEKSDHSHDDAEILEYADNNWQSTAQKATPADTAQGDLTGDGTPDLLIRGRGQYDVALLVNGKLVQDGVDLVPGYLGDIDSDGRIYTRGKGWSANPVVNGNLSDRNQAISLANGKLSIAGKFYIYNASSTLVPDAGTAAATSNVPTPPAPINAQPTLNAQDQQTMDSLGILSGEFKVSEAGAATYNLPLKLPQGTAGVAPDVSVGYSSQSGDGLMGLGWSLNTGGAISRCRQTLQIDKAALPITWTSTDRYCLNGQRLLVVSGTYGAADSQYKTEMDAQITVTQKGGSNGSADYFEVKAKDGSTSIYGVSGTDSSEEKGYPSATASCQTTASNGSCADKIMSWDLTQFSDRVGNKIQYIYENGTSADQKSYRLNSIKYAFANGQPNARIQFIYEAGKKETSLAAGYQFYRDSRLASVETYQTIGSENLLRKYSFNYNGDFTTPYTDGRDRLTSVLECSGESCLPPLRINWGGASPTAPNQMVDIKTSADNYSFGPNYLDINGDGRLDFITLNSNGSGDKYTLRSWIQAAAGNFTPGTFNSNLSQVWFTNWAGGQEDFQPHQMRVRTYPVDINNDGHSDVIVYREGTWELYLATPTLDPFPRNWTLQQKTFNLPFGMTQDALTNNKSTNGVQFGDVNSDGLVDAFFTENNTIYVSYLVRNGTTTGNLPYSFAAPVAVGSAAGTRSHKLVPGADFNGDGRLDFIGTQTESTGNGTNCTFTSGIKVFFQDAQNSFSNNLTVFSPAPQVIPDDLSGNTCDTQIAALNTEIYPENVQIADVNGDGAPDIVWTLTTSGNLFSKVYVRFGDGKGAFAATQTYPLSSYSSPGRTLQLTDTNSNGQMELRVNRKDSSRMYVYEWANNTFPAAPREVDSTQTGNVSSQFLDANADGALDTVEVVNNKLYVYPGKNSITDNLVTSFISGRGIKTTVNYEPLITTANYSKISDIGVGISAGQILKTEDVRVCTGTDEASDRACMVPTTHWVPAVNFEQFYALITNPFSDVGDYALKLDEKIPAMEYTGTVPVVTQVSSSAPTATDANATAKVAYLYNQAKMQAGGRGLLGFKSLSTVDLQTGVTTTTTYRQDWPFIGSPVSTVTFSKEGNKLSESKNTYLIYGLAQADLAAKKTTAQASGTQVLGPIQTYVNSSVETTYDLASNGAAQGSLIAQTVTSMSNDAYGNVTNLTVTTHDAASANGGATAALAVKQTTNIYAEDTTWKSLGRLMASTVTSKRRGQSDKTLSSKFAYFGVSGSSGLSCSRSSSALEGMLCTEQVVESGLTTNHYYDSFGNKVFAYSQGGGLSRLSPLSQYDSTGRFPEASFGVFNAPGANTSGNSEYNTLAASTGGRVFKVSEVVQRDKHGIALQTHNYNGGSTYTVSRTAVTPMGLPFFSADSSGASQEVRTNLDVTNCPAGSLYSTTKAIAGGAKTRVCFNKVGQELRAMSEGFDGAWVSVDKQYDVLGRVIKSSEPFTGSQGSYFTEVTGYDILGRAINTLLPFNTTDAAGIETATRASTSIAYSGFQQIITNPAGRTKTEVKNALGQLVSVTEPHGANSEPVTATYNYDAQGNLINLTDPNSNTSTLVYDALGRKTSMSDPDKGNWQYRYNAFGELICQQDAKGQIQTTGYDFAGRPTLRLSRDTGGSCDSGGTGAIKAQSEWIYDTAPYGLGKAEVERDSLSGFARTYGYDALGRANLTTTTFNGANAAPSSHYEKVTYDQYGRVFQSFDAARQGKDFSRNGVQNSYNTLGFLQEVKDATGTDTYYKVLTADVRGNVTKYQLAGGVTTADQFFNAKTGRLETITTTGAAGIKLEQYTAKWDTLGNLASRSETKYTNAAQNWTESFTYDGANRLRTNTFKPGSGTQTVTSVSYDAIGNITSKSDVGSYAYSRQSAGPHAVTSVGSNSYTYDANGSMTATTGPDARTVTYTTDDQAQIIAKGDQRSSFFYGPDKARYKRIDTKISTNASTTTLYIGGVEKIYYPDGQIEWKRNIAGVGQITIKVDANGTEQSRKTHYFHKDHLGTTLTISDNLGNIVQELAYDPWGQRRTVSSPTPLDLNTLQSSYFKVAKPITQRGFTGHEMIDEVGVIHMNGRIYDAKIGRFMQADPVIQDPSSIGSLNRYSYCANNPLNATDPSGFSFLSKAWKQLRPFIGAIVAIVLTIIAPEGAGIWYAMLTGALSGAASAAANGGNILKGAFMGALTSAAFFGVGEAFSGMKGGGDFLGSGMKAGAFAGKVLAHATVGGVMSVLQGGKFGHGFMAAGVTQAFSGAIDGIGEGRDYFSAGNRALRIASAAVVGGTTSRISGGKFANGAITGAFSRAFNDEQAHDDFEKLTSKVQALDEKWAAIAKNDPNSVIDVSEEEFELVVRRQYLRTKYYTDKHSFMSSKYMYDFRHADTPFFAQPTSSASFRLGNTVAKGGDINYIGVGMMSAKYGGLSMELTQTYVEAWNVGQFMTFQGTYNLNQAVSGVNWAKYGSALYKSYDAAGY